MAIVLNVDPLWTFPGDIWSPSQNFGPINLAVFKFTGYKQTSKEYIYILTTKNRHDGVKHYV